METDYFTTAVQSLKKPQDKKKLLQVLIIIRKGIDDSSTKLERYSILSELGTVKNLIGCLQLENNSILDISLSILGNCCLDAHFAKNLVSTQLTKQYGKINFTYFPD